MSIAFESSEVQLQKLRERLRLMSDEEEVIAQHSPWPDLRGQTHAPLERLKRAFGRDPN